MKKLKLKDLMPEQRIPFGDPKANEPAADDTNEGIGKYDGWVPNMQKWWEEDPGDLITFIYWKQGKIRGNTPIDQIWKQFAPQLNKQFPAPSHIFNKIMSEPLKEQARKEVGKRVPVGDWLTLTVTEDGFQLKNESGSIFHLTDEEFQILKDLRI